MVGVPFAEDGERAVSVESDEEAAVCDAVRDGNCGLSSEIC